MTLDHTQFESNHTQDFMSPTQRVSSRLAQKEKSKLVRQTGWLIGAALLLTVAFVFFILPLAIRFGAEFLQKGSPFEVKDAIPPQVPLLAAPPEATFSGELKLTAYGEPKSEIVMVVNGSEQSRSSANAEGNAEFTVSLTEGENMISVYALDEAENESNSSKDYLVVYDQEQPLIEITEPTDGASIETRAKQLTTISGKTEAKAKLYLNDRLVFTKADGSFSTTYQLQEGENALKFKAIDQAGNSTEREIRVTFRL